MQKIALITGANQGIGFALAQLLLEQAPQFTTIIFTARNQERGKASSNLLQSPRIDFQLLDVTNPSQISSLSNYISLTYGKLDLLINNAGAGWESGPNPHTKIHSYLSVNFYGLKSVTEEFLPLIPNGGQIVNLSTVLSLPNSIRDQRLIEFLYDPQLTIQKLLEKVQEFEGLGEDWREKGWKLAGSGVYGISKAFVNAYGRLIDEEMRRGGREVRVNAMHPGWVRTRMGGGHATLGLREGAEKVFEVIREERSVSGKFWIDGRFCDLVK